MKEIKMNSKELVDRYNQAVNRIQIDEFAKCLTGLTQALNRCSEGSQKSNPPKFRDVIDVTAVEDKQCLIG